MTGSRRSAFVIAAVAGLLALQTMRASAQWWSRAPADFEDCADAAEKSASKQDKTTALAECNAKFAGRRKPGGGYTYYDFMQDRTFDIAGPNPTAEEQKYIDEQYTAYLETQRRKSIVAAFSAKRQQQQEERGVQQASLRTETTERVPVPQARPVRMQPTASDVHPHAHGDECARHAFSCEWPRLSEAFSDLKKLFSSPRPKNAKKSG